LARSRPDVLGPDAIRPTLIAPVGRIVGVGVSARGAIEELKRLK
jgi:hypothetical protein